MMGVGYITRTHLDGPVAVVAIHGSARSGALHNPDENLRTTIDRALSGLPANPPPAPIPVTGWLRAVAADRSMTVTAIRAAVVFGLNPEGAWLGVNALASKLGIARENVPRAVRQLVQAGYLRRTKDGNRAIYRRALP